MKPREDEMLKGMFVGGAILAAGCAAGGIAGPEATVPEVTVPVLMAPGEGAVVDNGCTDRSNPLEWTFDWSDVPRAELYHLYVIGPGATIPAVDREVVASSYSQSSGAYVVDRNRRGWRWRVRASVGGVWQAFSAERTFEVEPLETDCPLR